MKLLIKLQEPPQNKLQTNEKEILRERYISQELRQKYIDDQILNEES